MTDRPRLYGVLATFRRPDWLGESLDRLARQTRPIDELIVVDNGSDKGSASLVEAYTSRGLRATYLDPNENLGPAGAFALGMEQVLETADADDWIFVFDDDDPPFYDDAIENAERFALRMIQRDPFVGAVGISGGRFDLRTGRVVRIGDEEITGLVSIDHITGPGLPAYRVAAIRKAGTFRKDLFFGFEELELGLRLVRSGFSLYADGDQWSRRKADKRRRGLLPPEEVSVARHRKKSVAVTIPGWRRYYSLRNLLLILREAGHPGTALRVALARGIAKPVVNLVISPRLAWANLLLNLKAIRDSRAGRLGRTVEPGTVWRG